MSILQQIPEAEVLLSPDRLAGSPMTVEVSDRVKHELQLFQGLD